MPANEGTLGLGHALGLETSDVVMISSSNSREKLTTFRSAESIIKNETSVNDESLPSYCSLPSRGAHEHFLRDFLELVLKDAVFEVSARLPTQERTESSNGWNQPP